MSPCKDWAFLLYACVLWQLLPPSLVSQKLNMSPWWPLYPRNTSLLTTVLSVSCAPQLRLLSESFPNQVHPFICRFCVFLSNIKYSMRAGCREKAMFAGCLQNRYCMLYIKFLPLDLQNQYLTSGHLHPGQHVKVWWDLACHSASDPQYELGSQPGYQSHSALVLVYHHREFHHKKTLIAFIDVTEVFGHLIC